VGLISDEAWQEYLAKQERQEHTKELLQKVKLTAAMVGTIQQAAQRIQPSSCNADAGDEVGSAERSLAGQPRAAVPTWSGDPSSAIGQPLAQLLKRPEITIEHLVSILRDLNPQLFMRRAHEGQPGTCDEVVAGDGPRPTDDAKIPSAIRNELKSVETEIKYEGYLQQQQRAIERLKKAEKRSIPDWFEYKSVSGLSREMQEKLGKVRPRTLGQASRIPGVTPAAVSLVNVYIEIQAKRREQATSLQAQ
jgi:tRNA uridine 5-carboxymethylaminomethyl modification enzyme